MGPGNRIEEAEESRNISPSPERPDESGLHSTSHVDKEDGAVPEHSLEKTPKP